MDVLHAELIPIEDRIYRLIPILDDINLEEEEERPYRPRFEDEDDYDPNLPILHQGNKFLITFNIPRQLLRHIIGAQHKTIAILEQQGAKINYDNDGTINISGSTRIVVSTTYHKAMDRVTRARLRNDSTHVITFPVNSDKIQESFIAFKKEILEKYGRVRGIDESIFQKAGKLHITVAPLVLLDERDNQNAIAILTKCKTDILKDFGEQEFIVQIKGIECMNDDPSEVDVLYAKVQEKDDDNSLQIIADIIMKEFSGADLSRKQFDGVKMHVTLMNTLFRSKLETKDDSNGANDELTRQAFDARSIFNDYKDYYFGQIVISEVHISIRYTEDSDGYYRATKKVKLN